MQDFLFVQKLAQVMIRILYFKIHLQKAIEGIFRLHLNDLVNLE